MLEVEIASTSFQKIFPLVAEKVSVVVGLRFTRDQLQETEGGFVSKKLQN